MVNGGVVIIAGMGEVGKPLHAILSRTYPCIAVDIDPVTVGDSCSVLHICYPYQIADFVQTTVGYIRRYKPELTIINSSVLPGTTRAIQNASQGATAYSPVRGKHVRMERELLRYKKFVAGCDQRTTEEAAEHFVKAGFETDSFQTPEAGELSKLLETTWFGILIGWAQEVERFASSYGASYEEVNSFLKEIDFLPSHIFPGFIGGHCVMPNIDTLRSKFQSQFLEAVVASNQKKREETDRSKEKLCPELV
jgi:UDP-N-acetyl-D-mannosaminuronate dehydrogenase